MGDGSSNFTFLFDDIELVDEGPYLSRQDLPVTFDDPTRDNTLTDFEGAYSEIVNDPTGGVSQVAKTTKSINGAPWAGTTMSTNAGFASRIPVTATETKMTVRVYAPRSGITVRLKIEEAGVPTKSVETDAVTTVGNAWETLEFDFSNQGTGTAPLDPNHFFNMASIFFFYGTNGAGIGADSVYYWDDVKFGPKTTGIEELQAMGLTYFPNPVQDQFSLRAAQQIEEVAIFTVMGQEVLKSTQNGLTTDFDLSFLSAGVYIVRVKMGETSGAFRLVKQ
jgi:hypothetical protein